MNGAYDRLTPLIGADGLDRLKHSSVLVVGVGGVGGAAVEALARSGVGRLTFVDGDDFEPSNLNRQILCTLDAIGRNKAEVAAERARAVNADVVARAVPEFFGARNSARILGGGYSFCIDAIDDVSGKTELITACKAAGIPIVSAMGAGNRITTDFEYTDIYKTRYDPFARTMRRALKNAGVKSLDVVCATTEPTVKSGTPASMAAPPMIMGLMLANFVVTRLAAV